MTAGRILNAFCVHRPKPGLFSPARDPSRQDLHRVFIAEGPHAGIRHMLVEISRCSAGWLAERRRGIEEQYRAWPDGASNLRQIELTQKSIRGDPEWLRIAPGEGK